MTDEQRIGKDFERSGNNLSDTGICRERVKESHDKSVTEIQTEDLQIEL
jgi:hypothetical protein